MYPFDVEHGHKGSQPCKGYLLHYASQGCFRLCKRPSRHDQSEFIFGQCLPPPDQCAQDSTINRMDCVELGLTCADVCKSFVQRDVIELGRRSTISRLLHAKSDSDTLAAWRSDLNRILHTFNMRRISYSPTPLTVCSWTALAINTQVAISDILRTIVKRRDGTGRSNQWVSSHTSFLMNRSPLSFWPESGLEFQLPIGLASYFWT